MSKAPTLDRNHPALGTIQPPYHGAMYDLHGNFFDGAGAFLGTEHDGRKWLDKRKAQPEPAAAPQPEPSEPDAPIDPTEIIEADGDDVDIVAWANGEKTFPFFAVKKAVSAAYSDIDTSNTETIIAGLIEFQVPGVVGRPKE